MEAVERFQHNPLQFFVWPSNMSVWVEADHVVVRYLDGFGIFLLIVWSVFIVVSLFVGVLARELIALGFVFFSFAMIGFFWIVSVSQFNALRKAIDELLSKPVG